jgi:spore maturation protein SpmA
MRNDPAATLPLAINVLLPGNLPLPMLGIMRIAIAAYFGVFDYFTALIRDFLRKLVQRSVFPSRSQAHRQCPQILMLTQNIYNIDKNFLRGKCIALTFLFVVKYIINLI